VREKILKFLFVFVFVFILASCEFGGDTNSNEYKIYVGEIEINMESLSVELLKGESYDIKLFLEENEVEVTVSVDGKILSIEGTTLKATNVGNTKFKIQSKDKKVYFDLIVTVNNPKSNLEVSPNEMTIVVGGSMNFTVEGSYNEVVIENNDIVRVEGNTVLGISVGNATIKFIGDGMEKEIKVSVVEKSEPKIIIDGEKDKKISLFETFDPMSGVSAMDTIDGDITDKIKVSGSVDNTNYGVYELTYSVTNSSNNTFTVKRNISVEWLYSVQFIGHAGSYYGIMNSEEAIIYAARDLKYQAIEVDLKQTSDGVFVLSHDDTFNGYAIASTPYSTLKDVEYTSSRSAGYPAQNGSVVNSPYTTKICTLTRYLEICKQYGVKAVIELKSSNGITNSSQTRMPALMKEISDCGMLNQVIFLGSQYNCLIWVKQNGYDYIPCQYLVNSCESEEVLNRCLQYDFEVSINVTGTYSNSDEWLARYKELGIKISTYTFTQWVDYDVVQTWIDKGVDYVTCDWHLISKLNLPIGENEIQNHTVTFKVNDEVVKQVNVKHGRTAAAPLNVSKVGYTFIGWDKDISKVTEDLVVNAQFEIIHYNVRFDSNLNTIEESSWDNKEAFVNDFYTDYFNWIETHYTLHSEITYSSGTYTITKNGVTVNFKNVDELKAIDIYDYEKTLSNFIYKPVIRNSDDSCEIVEDENYFLNSSAYRVKYLDVDRWLVNCINKNYTTYDKTYKPLSSGKIQIFFRMHQWAKGTSIAQFNTLPFKYIEIVSTDTVTLPDSFTYTILDEIVIPNATGSKTFVGWYLDKELTNPITTIKVGTTGDLVLYAKWQ